jgi:hypothetical protein
MKRRPASVLHSIPIRPIHLSLYVLTPVPAFTFEQEFRRISKFPIVTTTSKFKTNMRTSSLFNTNITQTLYIMYRSRESQRLKDKATRETKTQTIRRPCASPFLAMGRRGKQTWLFWEATFGSTLDLERIDGTVPEQSTLYADGEGYAATCQKGKILQWLPVKVGPHYTRRARNSPCRIQDGRHEISRQTGEISSPRMMAVADRVQSQDKEKIWYLVTWKLIRIPKNQLPLKSNTVTLLLEWVQCSNGDGVLQFAPSWICIDRFEPHEFALLNYFYEREGLGVLAKDESQCAALASLHLSHGQQSPPQNLNRSYDQFSNAQASGSTDCEVSCG